MRIGKHGKLNYSPIYSIRSIPSVSALTFVEIIVFKLPLSNLVISLLILELSPPP